MLSPQMVLSIANGVAMCALVALVFIFARAARRQEKRAETAEARIRTLASRFLSERAGSAKTVVAPEWHAPRRTAHPQR